MLIKKLDAFSYLLCFYICSQDSPLEHLKSSQADESSKLLQYLIQNSVKGL